MLIDELEECIKAELRKIPTTEKRLLKRQFVGEHSAYALRSVVRGLLKRGEIKIGNDGKMRVVE